MNLHLERETLWQSKPSMNKKNLEYDWQMVFPCWKHFSWSVQLFEAIEIYKDLDVLLLVHRRMIFKFFHSNQRRKTLDAIEVVHRISQSRVISVGNETFPSICWSTKQNKEQFIGYEEKYLEENSNRTSFSFIIGNGFLSFVVDLCAGILISHSFVFL